MMLTRAQTSTQARRALQPHLRRCTAGKAPIGRARINGGIEEVLPSMRNRLEKSSVAQCLDGEPSGGETACPRMLEIYPDDPLRATPMPRPRPHASKYMKQSVGAGRSAPSINLAWFWHPCSGTRQFSISYIRDVTLLQR